MARGILRTLGILTLGLLSEVAACNRLSVESRKSAQGSRHTF